MNMRMAWLAFPVIALAQSSEPPPDVDRALRARATEFLQCYVDGTFRKAYELVAEDTKDLYFGAPKNRIKSFEIGEIKYFDNFTRAEISVRAKKETFIPLAAVPIPTEVSEVEKFKIEDGKWFWYDVPSDAIVTPMSVSHVDPVTPGAKAPAALPQFPADLSPEGLRAAAAKLLGQISIDKSEVSLAADKPSEARVMVHNGMGGPVQVQLANFGEIPGFSAKLDKTQLGAGEYATLLLRYDAGNVKPGDPRPSDFPVGLRLVVSPTSQVFTVTVKLTAAR
jgi:hypothetical protein